MCMQEVRDCRRSEFISAQQSVEEVVALRGALRALGVPVTAVR
jgi:hypothetical protein